MSVEDIDLDGLARKTSEEARRTLLDRDFSEKAKKQLEEAEEDLSEHGPAEIDKDYVTPTDLGETVVERPKKKEQK